MEFLLALCTGSVGSFFCQASSLLISALVMLVPLVDCSTAMGSVEMSEQETELCALSAQFEEFVVHFLDRWVGGTPSLDQTTLL